MTFDLQKEEDVKLYVENLAIEYRFSCYKEKKPDGCHLLGDFLEAIKKDFKKAAAVYKMNCEELNYGKSCYKYGGYLLIGKGCSQSFDEAYSYFAKGCNAGSAQACRGAGLLMTSKWERTDYNKGLEYFDRGCKGDDPPSCFRASALFLKGVEGSIKQDYHRAYRYTKRGCELGHIHACANLSQMYRRGEGVAKDEALANKYKQLVLEIEEQTKKTLRPLVFGES